MKDAVAQLTYPHLISRLLRKNPELSKPQLANLESALTQYRRFTDATGEEVGQELGPKFEASLEAFLKDPSKATKSEGTLRNLKSQLRAWKRLHDELAADAQPIFESLRAAVAFYFEQAKVKDPALNYSKLAKGAGLPEHQVKRFFKSFAFKHQSTASVQRLEQSLAAPAGSLTRFVSQLVSTNKDEVSVFGKRQARLCAQVYRLTETQFNEQLSHEWRQYFDFKTAATVPLKLNLQRNKTWRLRPVAEAAVNSSWTLPLVTTKDGKQYAATAQYRFQMVIAFFGALAQLENENEPGSKKYDPRDFSLGWMADYDLITEVTAFLLSRFDGTYTNTMREVLITCQTFLHPQFGWVKQNPTFGPKLINPVCETDWAKWCADQLQALNFELNQLTNGGKFVQTRDPFVPIKEIIERQHPISALIDLAQNLEAFLQSHPMLNRNTQLSLYRTLFLVELLTEQPVRLKMLYIMTYSPSNTGNLYQRLDGTWALRFYKEAFKNERGAARKPYDVPFTEEFSRKIERYIKEILPRFPNRADLVFPPAKFFKRRKRSRSVSLETAFQYATRRFLPRCKGFRPHAVRHIIATDYIKNKESGWQTAADVLHDTVEVVRRAYAFLRAEDGHKFYKTYLTELRTQRAGESPRKGADG